MATFKYQHLHSSGATTAPSAELLLDGEIALNIKKGDETIYFKNTDGEVVELKVGDYYTKSETDNTFATKAALSALTDVVDTLDDAKQDKGDYVEWTPFTYDGEDRKTIQLENHYNISGKMTDTPAEGGFEGEAGGVNLAMVSKWNVADFGSTKLPINLNGAKPRPTYNDKKEIALLDDVTSAETYANEKFFADVKYETSGETKVINFYAVSGETPLATIDATEFIKDGMISAVTIDEETSELVITWNTDASTTETRIALTKIFNPEEYYTKEDVDGIIEDVEKEIGDVDTKVDNEVTRATKKEGELATAIENAKKVAITAATADYETNVLKLTLIKGEGDPVKVDMNVTDAGNGILLNSASVNGTIILSGGTF